MTARALAAAAALAVVAAACAGGRPRAILFGTEACAHCHMTIVDRRYAAVLVTTTGKQYAFDDPGCLAAFLAGGTVPADRVREAWFHLFLEPDSLAPSTQVRLVRSDTLRTPMASGLAAARAGDQAGALERLLGGPARGWDEVRTEARP